MAQSTNGNTQSIRQKFTWLFSDWYIYSTSSQIRWGGKENYDYAQDFSLRKVPTESLPTPRLLSTIRFSELYLKPLDENQKSFVVLVGNSSGVASSVGIGRMSEEFNGWNRFCYKLTAN